MNLKERNYKPARLLPFDLHDIKPFLIDEFPSFHPLYEQDLDREYWTGQINTCLNGKWGHDYNPKSQQGGYRFMPGNLYFYVNMTQIKIEGEEGREIKSKPTLRDIEWYMFYALTQCDGFSGFEDDEEFTCYKPIGKLQGKIKDRKGQKITKLTNAEKRRIEKYKDLLTKPNGEYKTYITPRECLYKTYDKPMGRAMYYNEMENLVVLSSRGIGKSFSIANGVVQYDFTFGSARNAEEFYTQQATSVSVVGSFKSSKSAALLSKFKDSYEYTRANVGAYSMDGFEENSPLYQPYDGSLATNKRITNRIKQEGGRTETGTGSEVWHVSYKDNAQAGVGFRARRMVVEEAGLLSNFEEVHGENSGTQRRETKIGYTVYIGTGGNIEKIKGIRAAFYDPIGHECVAFDDNWSNKPGYIGLFIPAYYRSIEYKDENGNTKYEEAFEDEMMMRDEMRKAGSGKYARHIISYPIVPQEMFMASDVNIFPADLLEDRITDLETGLWEKLAKPVKIIYTDDLNTKVRCEPLDLSKCIVIKRFGDEKDLSEPELAGTPIIYEHPVPHRPELSHDDYLYLVVYDSVGDEDGGTSLACVQVWKFWDIYGVEGDVKYNIVAEWMGRHVGTGGLDKDHEIAFKLAAYYNAPILPEINLKDVLRHGRMTNRFYFFLPRPTLTLEGMDIKQKAKGNEKVGVRISPQMKPELEKYLNVTLHEVVDYEENIDGDKYTYDETYMVQECPSLRFCEELLYYSRDENADAVSCGMLAAIASRQRKSAVSDKSAQEAVQKADDEFIAFTQKQVQHFEQAENPAFEY